MRPSRHLKDRDVVAPETNVCVVGLEVDQHGGPVARRDHADTECRGRSTGRGIVETARSADGTSPPSTSGHTGDEQSASPS